MPIAPKMATREPDPAGAPHGVRHTRAWRRQLASALGSLKFRVTLGGIVALVFGIGLITALLVHRAEHDTLQTQRQRELSDTARTAALLSRTIVDLQRDLNAAVSRLDRATLDDDAALERFIDNRPVLQARFDSLFVASTDGRMRLLVDAAGTRHPNLQLNDRDYFRRTLAEDRPIVSDAIASRITGEPVIVLTQPVRGPGGVIAVLAGSLRLANRDLISDLITVQEADGQAMLIVTDARGQVLAHPERSRVTHSLSDEPRLAQAFAAWVAQGSPVEPLGVDLPQAGEVVSAAGAAGPNWMVWRVRSEAELLEPLRAARREAVGWAAGLIAVLSPLLLGSLWWLLRPLDLLERRAQRLFSGQLDAQEGWPVATGEIGRLARMLKQVAAERSQLEALNTEVLRKLGSVMTAAPIGIAFTRAQRFELVSAEFCRLFGHDERAMLGQPARMIYASDDDYARLGPLIGAAFGAGHAYLGDWEMRRADGTSFWASLRGNPVAADDPTAGTIWTVTDISDQRKQTEQLTWSATHDALTGLANRKLFEQRSAGIVAGGAAARPATVVFIDLDRFNPINDTAGHAAGDAMLRAVAAALSSTVRNRDLVVRLGGDEFALLLEHCNIEVAARIAENARAAVSAISLGWNGRTLSVGASLGLACLTDEMQSAEEWLAAADAACYAAKAAGRGVVRIAPAAQPAERPSDQASAQPTQVELHASDPALS